jgi:hypothetical protein
MSPTIYTLSSEWVIYECIVSRLAIRDTKSILTKKSRAHQGLILKEVITILTHCALCVNSYCRSLYTGRTAFDKTIALYFINIYKTYSCNQARFGTHQADL